jgi:hypothetical protein
MIPILVLLAKNVFLVFLKSEKEDSYLLIFQVVLFGSDVMHSIIYYKLI